MKEIEVKILEINRAKVEKRLLSLGAKKVFEGKLYGLILDFPDQSLTKQNKQLRLRKEGEKVVLTLKEVISQEGVKEVDEFEVEVKDFEEMREILGKIGLKELFVLEKRRISYTLGENHFDIDLLEGNLQGIPEYMEIEGESTNSILELAKSLGYSKDDCKSWNSTELAEYYGKDVRGLID